MTSIEKIVMMANQIAANLSHEPDPTAAAAEHMRLFWDPRMKQLIRDHGREGLTPTAAAAIDLLVGVHAAG